MLPEKDIGCHRTGFQKTCRACVVEHSCQLWIQIMGHNPNTGEAMNKWACSDSIGHLLMIENSQMQRQTAAAVESFRNEMVMLNQDPAQRLPLLPNGHGCTQAGPALAKTS